MKSTCKVNKKDQKSQKLKAVSWPGLLAMRQKLWRKLASQELWKAIKNRKSVRNKYKQTKLKMMILKQKLSKKGDLV